MRTILLSSALLFGLVAHASADVCLPAKDVQDMLNGKALEGEFAKETGMPGLKLKYNDQKEYNNLSVKPATSDKGTTCVYSQGAQPVLSYKILLTKGKKK